jgi:hypothetical protein
MKLFKKEISKHKLLYGGLISTFTILYVATAFVSWYHAITFFNIANAAWLSVILSFVAEIGQASVLFSILLTVLKKTSHIILSWAVMILLTTLQVIGNVVSSYDWIISHNGAGVEAFQKSILFWIQTENRETFMIIIAWISGALLPIIALSMTSLVAQYMELRSEDAITKLDHDKSEVKPEVIDAKIIMSEVSKIHPTEEELENLDHILNDKKPLGKVPPEAEEKVNEISLVPGTSLVDMEKLVDEKKIIFKSPGVFTREQPEEYSPSLQSLIRKYGNLEKVIEELKKWNEMEKEMEKDEEVPTTEQLSNEEIEPVLPHYSDEELNEMFTNEYERKGDYFPEDNDLDEDAARLTPEVTSETQAHPDPSGEEVTESKEWKVVDGKMEPEHKKFVEEQSKINESQISDPNEIIAPEITPEPIKESEDEEKRRTEEERLERLRAIARENLKKK